MFEVTIKEITAGQPDATVERYKQVVDTLDLRAVINAVMLRPRKPRAQKPAKEGT